MFMYINSKAVLIFNHITSALYRQWSYYMEMVREIAMKQTNLTSNFCVFVILGIEGWKDVCKGNTSVLTDMVVNIGAQVSIRTVLSYIYVITVGLQMSLEDFSVSLFTRNGFFSSFRLWLLIIKAVNQNLRYVNQ